MTLFNHGLRQAWHELRAFVAGMNPTNQVLLSVNLMLLGTLAYLVATA